MNSTVPSINISVLQQSIELAASELIKISDFDIYARELKEIHEMSLKPLLVTIMGDFKTGKSTFINALLGEEVLSSDVLPATAVITVLSYGTEKDLVAHFKDGKTKHLNLSELAEITSERNRSQFNFREDIDYVEVIMPIDMLKKISIVDTPGLNVDNEGHIETTKKFMNKADFAFWVFDTSRAGTHSELNDIKELNPDLKPIAIINKIDEIDEEEESIDEAICTIIQRLSDSVQDCVAISAKQALFGIIKNDFELLQRSRWNTFLSILDKKVLQQSNDLKAVSVKKILAEYIDKMKSHLDEKMKVLDRSDANLMDETGEKVVDRINILKQVIVNADNLKSYSTKYKNNRAFMLNRIETNTYANGTGNMYEISPPLFLLHSNRVIIESMQNAQGILKKIDIYLDEYQKYLSEVKSWHYKEDESSIVSKKLEIKTEELEKDIETYNKSGLLGGAPLFDFAGNSKKLNRRAYDLETEINNHQRYLNSFPDKYRNCYEKMAVKNIEILKLLPQFIQLLEEEIQNCENEKEIILHDRDALIQRNQLKRESLAMVAEILHKLDKAIGNNSNELLFNATINSANHLIETNKEPIIPTQLDITAEAYNSYKKKQGTRKIKTVVAIISLTAVLCTGIFYGASNNWTFGGMTFHNLASNTMDWIIGGVNNHNEIEDATPSDLVENPTSNLTASNFDNQSENNLDGAGNALNGEADVDIVDKDPDSIQVEESVENSASDAPVSNSESEALPQLKPIVTFDGGNEFITSDDEYTFSGHISDFPQNGSFDYDTTLAFRGTQERSFDTNTGDFKVGSVLDVGVNTFTIYVHDKSKNMVASATKTVVFEPNTPSVSLIDIEQIYSHYVWIILEVTDQYAPYSDPSIYVDGSPDGVIADGNKVSLDYDLNNGANKISITTKNHYGVESEPIILNIDYDAERDKVSWK